jgi:hypothetical protein
MAHWALVKKEVNIEMANFFKQYRDAYKEKHIGEAVEINLIIPKNTGVTVPNPKTLGNKKRPQGKFVKPSETEEES